MTLYSLKATRTKRKLIFIFGHSTTNTEKKNPGTEFTSLQGSQHFKGARAEHFKHLSNANSAFDVSSPKSPGHQSSVNKCMSKSYFLCRCSEVMTRSYLKEKKNPPRKSMWNYISIRELIKRSKVKERRWKDSGTVLTPTNFLDLYMTEVL